MLSGRQVVSAALAAALATAAACAPSSVSTFGEYQGFSELRYTEFARTSEYVSMRDGTRLAVDVFRPAARGRPVDAPFPVLLVYSRYWRATERPDGSVASLLGTLPPGRSTGSVDASQRPLGMVAYLLGHGYVIAHADARGTGASFGYFYGEMSGVEARDGYDLVEWLASQPWSDGQVGMIGPSYLGMSQFLVASEAPPHLKAIFPAVATFDEYRVAWSGSGILPKYGLAWLANNARRDGVSKGVKGSTINPDAPLADMVARVDADSTGMLRDAARAERLANPAGTNPMDYFTAQVPAARRMEELLGRELDASEAELMEILYSTPRLHEVLATRPRLRDALGRLQFNRDEAPMLTRPESEGRNNLAVLVDRINAAAIPVYHWGGWRDFATLDTHLWFANLTAPQKMTVGPWTHSANEPNDPREEAARLLYPVEQLRWFDYWLKQIDNGIMDEPPIHFAVMDTKDQWEWRAADAWPLPDATVRTFHLAAGPSESVTSVNDGLLRDQLPPASGSDRFAVDYLASMGEHTRYHDAIGLGPQAYPDLVAHARTALTYTSAPLSRDLIVAGHPVVTLFVSSSAADGEFNAYLEEVDPNGMVHFLTDGVLRASHRKLGTPFYANLGLPWSSSTAADVEATPPLTAGVAQLEFDLQPVANLFEAGHRIRLVITGADAHTNLTIPELPAPEVTVWHGKRYPSRLDLPAIR